MYQQMYDSYFYATTGTSCLGIICLQNIFDTDAYKIIRSHTLKSLT